MNKNYLYRSGLPFFLIFIFSLLINNCDIMNPIEGLEVRLNTMTRESSITLYLYDAVTNKIIDDKATIKFKGETAQYITDITSNPIREITSGKGFVDFSIADGTEYNSENPFIVTVEISSAGHQQVTTSFKINEKGNFTKSFFLLNETSSSSNSGQQELITGCISNNGTTNQNIKLTTSPGGSIEIASGSILNDKAGIPLTGDLQITLQSISIETQKKNIMSYNLSAPEGSSFEPVYSFSIKIRDGAGNYASSINTTTLKLIMPLEEITINPAYQRLYQQGDEIDVYGINKNSSELVKIGSGVVKHNNSANISSALIIEATIAVDNFNLDNNFFIGSLYQSCVSYIKIDKQIIYNSFQIFKNGIFEGNASTTEFISTKGYAIEKCTGNDLISIRLNATISDPNSGQDIFTGRLSCGSNTVPFNIGNFSETVFTINVIGVCDLGQPDNSDEIRKVIYPSGTFSFRKIEEGKDYPFLQGSLVNGSCTISGMETGKYFIHAVYKNRESSANIIVNEDGSLSREDIPEGYLYYGEMGSGSSKKTITPENNPLIEGSNITLYMLAGKCN